MARVAQDDRLRKTSLARGSHIAVNAVTDIGTFFRGNAHAPGGIQQDGRVRFSFSNHCRKDDRFEATGEVQFFQRGRDFDTAGGVADQPQPVAAPEQFQDHIMGFGKDNARASEAHDRVG